MPIITTFNVRNAVAKGLIKLFGLTPNTSLYVTEGQQNVWPNTEPVPPVPNDTINQFKIIWDNMIFGKLITLNNLSIVVPRYNWTNNNVYTAYSDTNSNLYATQFYMITSNNEVYKCLANNNGGPSTIQPSGLGPASNNYIQATSDGYQWKYILQVQPGDAFLNNQWFGIPLVPPPNSLQSIVQNAAVPGSIDIIIVTNSGQSYANGSQQYIVNIVGDGVGANAYANVSNNQIQNIVIVSRGQQYNFATITFTDPNGFGATATAIMPPPGGHGSEADTELGGDTVMVSVVTANSEQGFLTTTNQFRQATLLLNPLQFSSNTIAANARFKPYTTLNVSGGVGTYAQDETVFQGTSINTATFSGSVIDFDPVAGILRINNTIGIPINGSILYGLASGAQRYITNIMNPDIQKYTGQFLEIDNETPIQRTPEQQELLQFILQM